jgi:acetyltransferase-like isoleucine patch superfamily enzyme
MIFSRSLTLQNARKRTLLHQVPGCTDDGNPNHTLGEEMTDDLKASLRNLQSSLQAEISQKFKRRVSMGDLITDRWENARQLGWGEGTSCYDNVLVLGDVKVGRKSWIGPNVILDGSAPGGLVIGDFCSISAGVQIYTHDTVAWSVSMGEATVVRQPTRIGSGVYIGPNAIISMNVTIGDRVVIGAMSFVNTDIPADAQAWGCPARVVKSKGGAS